MNTTQKLGQSRNLWPKSSIPHRVAQRAIARWENVLGRPAPSPTEPGRARPRLSAAFCEWMMGLPAGWVTDVPGITRKEALKALGNGVVPQQGATALTHLLTLTHERNAA